MSTAFQTAVRTNVQREKRYAAIDRLVASGDRTSLAVVVRTGGLDGEFRRRALEGLADCGGSELLAELADDTTIERSLRRRAEQLA
ncbi:hypothetical protein ACFOZ7_13605 [Natribaculum luteum]|uniref:HEAT repeat domain-containing protein n=1 Tax=Natribaculum luteum TaxID=1586232 RepID=A0ABD5P1N4_9EURY|nr:hypothetical protein [Natribaculum luteum]